MTEQIYNGVALVHVLSRDYTQIDIEEGCSTPVVRSLRAKIPLSSLKPARRSLSLQRILISTMDCLAKRPESPTTSVAFEFESGQIYRFF
ncbi:hypothetical protein AMAG_18532 [Allomyces macrogynus ATCC 38327]|uniref:Uncharacterized protein n=1 Tax=Allomyces macrogynus (strain ATCC 38327) TaxID=578462 RepID=A0A0L0SD69_ALLM3|nr:hypothetical protein AMAG_18532 [Allomyces macrogynus ATCC 38327]|eukprot:KNE60426.1 hypothetical protein AMAG_18532 [Allomyces macrogynus ATCC 38327]